MTITLIAVAIAGIVLVSFYAYYGGFKAVTCRMEKQGGEILVYKQMKGDYARSGKVMDEIYYALLNDFEIETFKGFGIYYDNPQKVEKSHLRSEVGCILEPQDSSRMEELKKHFEVRRFPEKTYVVTEFPNKGKPSVMMGIFKVYPAINKFVETAGLNKEGAVMELYDMPNNIIMYRKDPGSGSQNF